VAGLEQDNQYNIGPRLIVISQAIGDKRIPKFISSGWDVFKRLAWSRRSVTDEWRVSFFRQQILQARRKQEERMHV